MRMPRPKPPVAARPKRLSITEVEKLIRDPYAIYARRVLRLEPLRDLVAGPTTACADSCIHEALDRFAENILPTLPDDAEDAVAARSASEVFAQHLDNADVLGFWWPRFERVIPWWIEEERVLRAELDGSMPRSTCEYDFDGFTLDRPRRPRRPSE